jgi:capsular exopolysaccharide synthesis family protein
VGQAHDLRRAAPATDLYGAHAATIDDPALDYRNLAGTLVKHRWMIAGITAASLAVGLVHTLLQTPVYRASATIEIKREAANISGMAGLEPADARRGGEFYQTQYELLKSRALAGKVVEALGLAGNPDFYDRGYSGWDMLRQLTSSPASASVPDIAARQVKAEATVLEGLSVEPIRASSIVRISFEHPDPRTARQVADAVAETFISSNIERSLEASAFARAFLEERLQDLRLKLEQSERELVAYAENQDILATASDHPLASVNLADTNRVLGEVGKERLRHELRWRQAEASRGGDLPHSLETTAIQELRAQRNALSLTYEDRHDFKPAFPGMVRLRGRIDEIDRQIASEADRIRDSLRANYEAALEEETALLDQMEELKSQVMDFQSRNIRYTILQREVDTNRSLYEGLLQRYKEIGVAGGLHAGNSASAVSIVDRAQVPASPYKPQVGLNLAAALVIGLMLGGATAVGRELLDNSIRTPDELEDGLALPLLGIIPVARDIVGLEGLLRDHRSPPVEAYRSLRAAVQFSTAAGTPKSILVTSALEAEGKSTAAVNLAAQFAKMGLRVLLIDADMRKPSLHRLLGCHGSGGLSQYLAAGPAPAETIRETALPGLTLLPSGPIPADPAGLLSGIRMASLISIAMEEFDLVVVDAPPAAVLADAPLLASMCQATLFVVEANRTHRKAVTAAVKRLRLARAEIIGLVLNKFDVKRAGYGYGHIYGDSGYRSYSTRQDRSFPGLGLARVRET